MQKRVHNEIWQALRDCRHAFLTVAWMSGIVNILYLTGSFFMLEVYDRVIPSRSVPTLLGLGVLAITLYAFQGILEAIRSRILTRIGISLDEALADRVYDVISRGALTGNAPADGLLPLRDLDQIRGFLSGTGPGALFDLPWMPIYIIICAMFHPYIGLAAIFGLAVLISLTLLTDLATGHRLKAVVQHTVNRNSLAEAGRRNAEVLTAMGMRRRFIARWGQTSDEFMACHQNIADLSGGFTYAGKVFRGALQSGVLGLGAWLVINNEATGGVIIASSILVSRALAPAEIVIANWKNFIQTRQAWRRLSDQLSRLPPETSLLLLPPPRQTISCEGVSIAPPGTNRFVVRDVSFELKAGQGVGIIGPSASGKSSLVRALVGIWPTQVGKVRIDEAAIDQWTSTDLGQHIGFMPQEVELFAGTIAENISRFDPDAPDEAIVRAAQAAGVHSMILRLPEGYDTRTGDGGTGLSAGQRQRIGLARALYGDPFLVVLDEPNANLDHEGENALTQAITSVRMRGGICVVVAHRPSALAALDRVMILTEGRLQAFGPKDEVLKRFMTPVPNSPPPVAPLEVTPPNGARAETAKSASPALQESA